MSLAVKSIKKGTHYFITYQNNEGDISKRKIKIISFYTSSYGKEYIKAWCYLRNEERTFRCDRIAGITEAKKESVKRVPVPAVKPADQVSAGKQSEKVSVPIYRTELSTGQQINSEPAPGGNLLATIFCFALTFCLFGMMEMGPFLDYFLHTSSYKEESLVYLYSSLIVEKTEPAVINAAVRRIYGSAPFSQISSGSKAFRLSTGIKNIFLEKFYFSADTDNSNSLSWSEVENFQEKICSRFDYILNETAWSPDIFLKSGGGDCEDWALFTCGLLTYWGIESVVGVLRIKGKNTGHAVCLMYIGNIIPGRGLYYEIDNVCGFKPGVYIPIDYENIGSFSNAVGEDWVLKEMYKPEEIYGKIM